MNVGGALLFSAVVVTLTLSFLFGFLPNFIYGLLPSNPRSSSNMGFVQRTISKMADKMATAYQFACCGHTLIRFLPNFIYGLFPSYSRPILNMGFFHER